MSVLSVQDFEDLCLMVVDKQQTPTRIIKQYYPDVMNVSQDSTDSKKSFEESLDNHR